MKQALATDVPAKYFVIRVRLKSDPASALGWLVQPNLFLRIGERPTKKPPPSPAIMVSAGRPPRNSGGHQYPQTRRPRSRLRSETTF